VSIATKKLHLEILPVNCLRYLREIDAMLLGIVIIAAYCSAKVFIITIIILHVLCCCRLFFLCLLFL